VAPPRVNLLRQVTPVRFANALAYGAVLPLTPDKKATMIKKLISLTLASVSTLALAGCGASDNPIMDTSLMGDGSSNKTGLGGYWWTYVDRSGKSSVSPDTGKIDPMDTTTTPAKLKPSIGVGNGIEDGMYHVTGTVGVAPAYNDTTVYDTYWDGFYGTSGSIGPVCGAQGCLEMKYPAVGIGLGFKAKNAPLGADADKKAGISFKMKIGPKHPDIATAPIAVSLPMDLTDVPDPTFNDEFGTNYAGIAPVLPALAGKNVPICTFPGSLKADGSMQGSNSKSCFANMTTDGTTKLDPTTTLTTYCLGWAAFGQPSWATGALSAASPIPVTDVAKLKAHIIKLQFDAFKPAAGAAAAVDFDFYVDDVILVDEDKWDTVCKDAKIFPAGT
jgi:hypothetical protein